ncbi:Uncharacterised protein g11393 [Pycnogonum litorale]
MLVGVTYSTINWTHESSLSASTLDVEIRANISTSSSEHTSNSTDSGNGKLNHIGTTRMMYRRDTYEFTGSFQSPRMISSAIILIILFFVVIHGSRGIGSVS